MSATENTVKFPDVVVELSGSDGNAFAVMGKVTKALRRAGHDYAVADFREEATSGDYDHLLQTCMRWVEVD